MNSLHWNIAFLFGAIFLFGCAEDYEGKYGSNEPYTYALTSPGSKFGALPPAAQNTVRAQAGAGEITDVITSYGPEGPTYTVYFRNYRLYPPLHVAADGTLLHPDLSVAIGAPKDNFSVVRSGPVTGVKPSELPAAAITAVQDRDPNAQIASINKETWGDRNVFIVTFTDPEHHPRLYITADGKILNEGPK